jgi:hypothetical protein
MDQNGKIHKFSNTHGDFAKAFAKNPFERENYMENMFQKNWLRLNYYGNSVYAHNSIKCPNEKQMRELKSLAIENNVEKIVWDSEENEKVLWHIYFD